MNNTAIKAIALGSSALVAAGCAAAVPAMAEAPTTAIVQTCESAGIAGMCAVQNVQGTFSFTQDVLTSNDSIAETFGKAAATLCQSLPTHLASGPAAVKAVNGDNGASTTFTIAELASQGQGAGAIMACSCASNTPGGWAIANAEISGLSVETIALLASAI